MVSQRWQAEKYGKACEVSADTGAHAAAAKSGVLTNLDTPASLNAAVPREEGLFMQETVWDAALLIGMKKDGQHLLTWFQVVVVLVLALGNFLIQSMLVSSIGYNLAVTSLTDEAQIAVLEERLFRFQKYELLDGTDVETQTARLCKDKLFTQVSRLHTDITAYLDSEGSATGLPFGSLVAGAATLLFTLSMIVEFYRILDEATHVYSLPSRRSFGSDTVKFLPHQNVNVIFRMTWQGKAAVTAMVLLPRLAIAFLLLLLGLAFIATTLSVEDLILNSVALEVVKDVDEYLFRALVPAKLRNLVARTRLPRVGLWRERTDDRFRWKGVSYKDVVSTLARCGFVTCWVAVAHVAFLAPFLASVRDFRHSLCGGSRDVVWRSHEVSPLLFFADTATGGDGSGSDLLEEFRCVSAANGDVIRIRGGFEPLRSAPNESLREMLRGDSPACDVNGGGLRCPELTIAELHDFDLVTEQSYARASYCKNLEVHMAVIGQTCSSEDYIGRVPFFEGRSACADFAELCQCSAHDESGFCIYTNFTELWESHGISESWVGMLQSCCPETCGACQRGEADAGDGAGRRRLDEAEAEAGGMPVAEGLQEPAPAPAPAARAVVAAGAGPRRSGRPAKPRGAAAAPARRGPSKRLRQLEERVAALELRNAELEGDSLLEGLEQRLALLEALTANLAAAEDA